jgi:hypothetical protein
MVLVNHNGAILLLALLFIGREPEKGTDDVSL